MHSSDAWDHLNKMTLAIFQAREDDMKNRMEVYKKQLEDAANK